MIGTSMMKGLSIMLRQVRFVVGGPVVSGAVRQREIVNAEFVAMRTFHDAGMARGAACMPSASKIDPSMGRRPWPLGGQLS